MSAAQEPPWFCLFFLSQANSAYSQLGQDSSSISDLVATGCTTVANTKEPLSRPLLRLPCALYLLLPVLRAALSSSRHTVLHHLPSYYLGPFPLSHQEFRESRQGKSSSAPFMWAQTSQLQHCQSRKASLFPLTHYSLSNPADS